jgi:hypothetical protein
MGDALAGKADIVQERGEAARGVAVFSMLADDEFGKRGLLPHIVP